MYPELSTHSRLTRVMGPLLIPAWTTICSLAYFLLCPTFVVASPALATNISSSSNSIFDPVCYPDRRHLTVDHCEDALWGFYSSIPRGEKPTFTNDRDKAMALPHYIWTPLHSTFEECTFSIHLPHDNDVTVDAPTLYSEGRHLISRCVGWWGVSGGHIAVRGAEPSTYVWIEFLAYQPSGVGQSPGNGNVTEAFVLPVNSSMTEATSSSVPKPSDVLAAK